MQAGLTHSPPLCSHGAGDGGETAPVGRLAEGKAFSSHFGRQSLPLRDRHPFEILCLTSSRLASSHLSVEQGLQKPPSTQAPWPAAPALFVQGPSTGPEDMAVFQLGCGNEPC